MKIGVLTSSRAEFGIYLPLLKKMKSDPYFEIEVIAFGTHLSPYHGYSLEHILKENFAVPYRLETMVIGDTPEAMSSSMGLTLLKFASFWAQFHSKFDFVFCIGDRFEMLAAVMSATPFGVKFIHFHGGELSLGSLDNIFRDSISLCSCMHFTSTQEYADRLSLLLVDKKNIYTVGAMSLDNISSLQLYSKSEFLSLWAIDLNKPTVLVTMHPETTSISKNADSAKSLAGAINQMDSYQIVVTMPNLDASGAEIRNVLTRDLKKSDRIFFVENFGTKGYFTCMKYCSFLLGNTSSGIIEAASFNKYVINLGDRQKGRSRGTNVYDCEFSPNEILNTVKMIEQLPEYEDGNIYWAGGAVKKVIEILNNLNEN